MFEKLSVLYAKPAPVVYAVPFFLLLIFIEWYFSHDRKKSHEPKDTVASIAMGFGSIFGDLVSKSLFFVLFWYLWENHRLFDIPFAFWSVVLLVFADDFSFYWHHRLSHEIRLLWASHVNHHSSQLYNLSTALRQSWTEILYKYSFYIWMPLVGFHPMWIFTMIACSLIYQFWIHTEFIKKLPAPIEWFFNTPSHHRVHHASNPVYLDKNYGGILIIWDRLFGSFKSEDPQVPVIYGITTNIHTYNVFKIATHEFSSIFKDLRGAKSAKEFWGYLFGAPGWRPDGNSMTAKELQKGGKG